jgi:stage IV sporulation protein A
MYKRKYDTEEHKMATQTDIYRDIATRTGGDIYIGVVGPVRTGKSTFIKKFMETLVIPNIPNEFKRERAVDELPQSAAGKTIMTTEPKFIPDEAVEIVMDDNAHFNVRMIDCVGYVVDSALGYIENEQPRRVMTPWDENEMEFQQAAEIGTRKVICEHSTIGLVITTDGSIGEIPRSDYEPVERRIIDELKAIDKPFVLLVNSMFPDSDSAQTLRARLEEEYDVPAMCVNCLELDQSEILDIIKTVLMEFPLKQIEVNIPEWINSLDSSHWLKRDICAALTDSARDLHNIREVKKMVAGLSDMERLESCRLSGMDLGVGSADIKLDFDKELYYKILSETAGVDIANDGELIEFITAMSSVKEKYDKIKSAFEEAQATGYGIVNPGMEDLRLDEPEIFKQGGRFGVKLKASAPSYHIIQANIKAEVSPIVGSEKQSEELIMYLMEDFEENPQKIWESNIFGKSVHELVNEGLQNKLSKMPEDARYKLQETLSRIINEGSGGLICIIL